MEDLRVDVVDHVAVVSIDRPPVNALRAQTFREISEIFDGFAHRRDVRVAILTAAGERAFCAGVDLNDSARRHSRQLAEGDSPADLLDPGAVPRACFESVLDCAVLVISAINGATVGAGVALAASCDVLVASTRARFALTEIDAGVLGGGRHPQRLVGPHKARLMFFTGDFVSAEEFHRLGAVEAVVPPEALLRVAQEIAVRMARKSPIGLRLAKESGRVEHPAAARGLPHRAGLHDPRHPLRRFRGAPSEAREARAEVELALNRRR